MIITTSHAKIGRHWLEHLFKYTPQSVFLPGAQEGGDTQVNNSNTQRQGQTADLQLKEQVERVCLKQPSAAVNGTHPAGQVLHSDSKCSSISTVLSTIKQLDGTRVLS